MLLPIFADMAIEGWAAIVIGIGGIISAVASGYVLIMQARAKVNSEARQQQTTEHERILEWQGKELTLQSQQIHEQQEAINRMHKAHAECREESAEFYGFLRVFRTGWVNVTNELRKLGGSPPDVPELPPRKPIILDEVSSEFLQRTTAQNTELVNKLDKTIRSQVNNSNPASSSTNTIKPGVPPTGGT